LEENTQNSEKHHVTVAVLNPRLTLYMAYSCTKFEVSSFNRFGDILGGPAFKKCHRDPDHAPFREGLPPSGWDLL